jgi:hypothetical protein
MIPNGEKRRFGIISSSSMNILSNSLYPRTTNSTNTNTNTNSTTTTTTSNTTTTIKKHSHGHCPNNRSSSISISSGSNKNAGKHNSNNNHNNITMTTMTTATTTAASNSSSSYSHNDNHNNTKDDNNDHNNNRRNKNDYNTTMSTTKTRRTNNNVTNTSNRNTTDTGTSTGTGTGTSASSNRKNSTSNSTTTANANVKTALGDIYQGCLEVWNQQKERGGGMIASCISPSSSTSPRYRPSSGVRIGIGIGAVTTPNDDVVITRTNSTDATPNGVFAVGTPSISTHNTSTHNTNTRSTTTNKDNHHSVNHTRPTTTTTLGHFTAPSKQPLPTASSSSSSSSSQQQQRLRQEQTHKKMPGIFHLMDQHQWQRVQQRALKYPKECRMSAVVSSNSISSSSSSSSSMNVGKEWHGQQQQQQQVHKYKALHYACHRLRRVHGYIRKCIAESMLQGDENDNCNVDEQQQQQQEEEMMMMEDPWVEACKAILVILEQYPEAAKMRETKHGCLPIHLAVFAMCPTPNVIEWVNEKEENDDCDDADDKGHGHIQKKSMRKRNGHGGKNSRNHHGQDDMDKNVHVVRSPSHGNRHRSPRVPRQRRLSHSSSSMEDSSCGSSSILGGQSQSLDGWSANMEQECGGGLNDVMDLEKLELQLRSRPDAKLSPLEEASLLESARLLSCSSRDGLGGGGAGGSSHGNVSSKGMLMLSKPSSLHSIMTMTSDGGRSTSMGSYASSCSVSVMSATSSIQASTTAECKRRRFNLKNYMANRETREEYSLKVLHALLDAYPKCVRVDSEGGRLPLHTAVAGKATLSIIETLAKAYPYACRHRNMENSLPLHLAACYGVSDPGVAPMLLKLYPYACVGRNRWERTPLEEALLKGGENGREHQEALCWVLRKPPEYWTGGYFGDNMTYEELRKRFAPMDFGRRRVDDENLGTRTEDNDAKTEGCPRINQDNLFSLIKERQWGAIVSNIDKFKEQASRSTKCELRGGQIAMVSALYFTCELDPTYDVLDALIKTCPGATTWRKQPGGQLPIHALCTWGGSREAIAFLLAACPESAKRRDDSGNLALHAACYSGAPESVVQSLLLCDPKAVNARNIQGSTPRDIVCQLSHRNRKKVLHLIENVSLELLEKKRCHEKKKLIENQINSQIDKVLEEQSKTIKEKSSKRRSLFRFSRRGKKEDLFSGDNRKQQPQQTFPPKMNITGSPPPEENIEVSLEEEESCEDLLWV